MFIKSKEILDRLVGANNWVTMVGLDYDTLFVKEGITMPTKEEFNTVKNIVENEYNNTIYKEQRVTQYPKIEDQLDMLWHAIDSGSLDKDSDFYKSLKAVKQQFPKPI